MNEKDNIKNEETNMNNDEKDKIEKNEMNINNDEKKPTHYVFVGESGIFSSNIGK